MTIFRTPLLSQSIARQRRLRQPTSLRWSSTTPRPLPPNRSYEKNPPTVATPTAKVDLSQIPEHKPGFISRHTTRLFSRVFKTKPVYVGPKDPARGQEAAKRVVREGVLDPRYKQAAKVYTRLIVALPIALYLTWELYRRRFLGAEKKAIPAPKTNSEEQGVMGEETHAVG